MHIEGYCEELTDNNDYINVKLSMLKNGTILMFGVLLSWPL